MPYIRKAYAYITRTHNGATQALVFQHPHPEGGIQIPKGTVQARETPWEAVQREIIEETGLTNVVIEKEIVVDLWEYHQDDTMEIHERHFFLVRADSAPDEWQHVVTGEGADEGMVFHYFWIASASEVEIVFGHGDHLDQIFS